MPDYEVWIEAECWEEGTWTPEVCNTDVVVTFEEGSAWAATFFSYANILSLAKKNQQTGECLSGKWFWASNMALVDTTTRAIIEAVIADMLAEDEFNLIFVRCPPDHNG